LTGDAQAIGFQIDARLVLSQIVQAEQEIHALVLKDGERARQHGFA
jgi:hypothetical protein